MALHKELKAFFQSSMVKLAVYPDAGEHVERCVARIQLLQQPEAALNRASRHRIHFGGLRFRGEAGDC